MAGATTVATIGGVFCVRIPSCVNYVTGSYATAATALFEYGANAYITLGSLSAPVVNAYNKANNFLANNYNKLYGGNVPVVAKKAQMFVNPSEGFSVLYQIYDGAFGVNPPDSKVSAFGYAAKNTFDFVKNPPQFIQDIKNDPYSAINNLFFKGENSSTNPKQQIGK